MWHPYMGTVGIDLLTIMCAVICYWKLSWFNYTVFLVNARLSFFHHNTLIFLLSLLTKVHVEFAIYDTWTCPFPAMNLDIQYNIYNIIYIIWFSYRHRSKSTDQSVQACQNPCEFSKFWLSEIFLSLTKPCSECSTWIGSGVGVGVGVGVGAGVSTGPLASCHEIVNTVSHEHENQTDVECSLQLTLVTQITALLRFKTYRVRSSMAHMNNTTNMVLDVKKTKCIQPAFSKLG